MQKVIVLLGLAIPGLAAAQPQGERPLSYDFAELRIVDADDDGDGLELNGSYEIAANWIVAGGIEELDFGRFVDRRMIRIGGGYVWRYREEFDLIGTVQYVDLDLDTRFGGRDDNGIALSAGIRGRLSPAVEWRGSVHHVNLDDSDTYFELAGDYYLSERIAVGLGVELGGDSDAFTIGGRWYF